MPVPTNLAAHRLRQSRPYAAGAAAVKDVASGNLLRANFSFTSAQHAAPRDGCYRCRAVGKKTRTPPPPRPVQAPQRRKSGGSGSTDNRTKWLLIAFAASGVIGLAAVAAVIALASGGSSGSESASNVASTMEAAGCTFKTVKAKSREHTTSLDTKIKYNTTPPSNGEHYYSPATWGFFETPADPIQVVHNEEHGGVIVWWGDKVPQSTVDELHNFYSSSPNGMIGTPYPSLGNKVALTAWTSPEGGEGEGRVAVCSSYDEKAFTTFRDAFRGKGPERFPLDTLTPGA